MLACTILKSCSFDFNFSPKNFKRNVFTPLTIGLLFGPYSMVTFEKYKAEERNWTSTRSKFMLGSSTLRYNSRIHLKAGEIAQSNTFEKRTHKRTKTSFQSLCQHFKQILKRLLGLWTYSPIIINQLNLHILREGKSFSSNSTNIFLLDVNFENLNVGLYVIIISFMLAKFQEDQRSIAILSIKCLKFQFL